MIRFLFVFSLAIWLGGFSGAQDFYGPDHEGMRYTLWRADGEQFATWGEPVPMCMSGATMMACG